MRSPYPPGGRFFYEVITGNSVCASFWHPDRALLFASRLAPGLAARVRPRKNQRFVPLHGEAYE